MFILDDYLWFSFTFRMIICDLVSHLINLINMLNYLINLINMN